MPSSLHQIFIKITFQPSGVTAKVPACNVWNRQVPSLCPRKGFLLGSFYGNSVRRCICNQTNTVFWGLVNNSMVHSNILSHLYHLESFNSQHININIWKHRTILYYIYTKWNLGNRPRALVSHTVEYCAGYFQIASNSQNVFQKLFVVYITLVSSPLNFNTKNIRRFDSILNKIYKKDNFEKRINTNFDQEANSLWLESQGNTRLQFYARYGIHFLTSADLRPTLQQ